MELRQLEYFVAVAEEAGFTRAAARVHISQSGVSAQIRQLERELGAELIDRSGRTARLTSAGAAALEHARAALSAAESVRQAVGEVADLIRGRLSIGMITACTVTPFFDGLSAFHDAHPGVEIVLSEDTSDRLAEQVRTGLLDLALIGAAAAPPEDLSSFTIVSERLVAAVRPDHPLAKSERPSLGEVCTSPIVSLPAGTGIRTVFDRACAAQGLRPDIALQASAPDTVADLAARGLGTAILSESSVRAGDSLAVRIIDDVDIPGVLALVWPKAPGGPALRTLVDHVRRAFGG
ncbi:LysR family transcriptional regulator [Phytomonospora endophytica]|uniref:DNA-binding transcriptional LysR family regulator n=1 Tax=Phytomonospora endophytica TaxID=714109 RepID=A0A841FE63_9ACTN|nr:LysR family transcriptional regulator [Phytomonospora endophytica]MBB6035561.1 DNA-binding transcriptional LysR family regulator [Phytomonospora endophytica]GIG70076.1 LysR family transcriptional regulator [Phytomonospora endophytica]